MDSSCTMATADVHRLLDRIVEVQEKLKLSEKSYTQLSNVDWDEVAFDDFSGTQCKQVYISYSDKVRKTKTCKEVLVGVQELLRKVEPPKPRRTAFQIFAKKKRPSLLSEKNMVVREGLLRKMFANLSSKKKKRYEKVSEEDAARYKQEKIEYDIMKLCGQGQPPVTPVQFYVDSRLDMKDDLKSQVSVLLAEWKAMTKRKKKGKWIARSLESRYDKLKGDDMKAAKMKLTSDERDYVLHFLKQPKLPPKTVQELYEREEGTEDVALESLSTAEKNQWRSRLTEEKTAFQTDYQRWYVDLPEWARLYCGSYEKLPKHVLVKEGRAKPIVLHGTVPPSYRFFAAAKREKFRAQLPSDINRSALRKVMKEAFIKLSDEKREKWDRKYEESQQKKAHREKSRATKKKMTMLEGEPQQPPISLYSYFSKMRLRSIPNSEVRPQQKMGVIAEEYNNWDFDTKKKYEKEYNAILEKYRQDLTVFYQSLDAERKALFDSTATNRKIYPVGYEKPGAPVSKAKKRTKPAASERGSGDAHIAGATKKRKLYTDENLETPRKKDDRYETFGTESEESDDASNSSEESRQTSNHRSSKGSNSPPKGSKSPPKGSKSTKGSKSRKTKTQESPPTKRSQSPQKTSQKMLSPSLTQVLSPSRTQVLSPSKSELRTLNNDEEDSLSTPPLFANSSPSKRAAEVKVRVTPMKAGGTKQPRTSRLALNHLTQQNVNPETSETSSESSGSDDDSSTE